ncbi:MAG: hydrogenase maturation protease [Acidobacteriia bacterium]|nr:hydrogenase maturation protease [Terriglobia bacterium]
MNPTESSNLVVALGNDLLGDDAIGLLAARELRKEACGDLEIVELAGSGVDLLEFLENRAHVLILDAAVTGRNVPGTILEFADQDFENAVAPSPHYSSLADAIKVARCLGIPIAPKIQVLALEVENPYRLGEGLTPAATEALPLFVERAKQVLESWFTSAREHTTSTSST